MNIIHNPRGFHLIIDALECNSAKIADAGFIYQFLDAYPAEINMTKVSIPFVRRYFLGGAERIFGFVMIAESHISISTNITDGKMDLDIYSCKELDINKAIKDVINAFGVKRGTIKTLIRGEEFLQVIEDMLLGGEEVEQRRQPDLPKCKETLEMSVGKGN